MVRDDTRFSGLFVAGRHLATRSGLWRLKDGAVVAPHRPRPDIVALALVLFVFGGIAWIAGSKYTVEGWVIGLNLFATWLGIDSAMPTPRGVLLLFLIVGVGLVYSLVDLLVWRAS